MNTRRCERCGLHTSTPAEDGWWLLPQEMWPLCPDCAAEFGVGLVAFTEKPTDSQDSPDVSRPLG